MTIGDYINQHDDVKTELFSLDTLNRTFKKATKDILDIHLHICNPELGIKETFRNIKEMESSLGCLLYAMIAYREDQKNYIGVDQSLFLNDSEIKLYDNRLDCCREEFQYYCDDQFRFNRNNCTTNRNKFQQKLKSVRDSLENCIYLYDQFQKEYNDYILEIYSGLSQKEIMNKFENHLNGTLNTFKKYESEINEDLDSELRGRLEARGIRKANYALDYVEYANMMLDEISIYKKEIVSRLDRRIRKIAGRSVTRVKLAKAIYALRMDNKDLDKQFRLVALYGKLCDIEWQKRYVLDHFGEMMIASRKKRKATSDESHMSSVTSNDGRICFFDCRALAEKIVSQHPCELCVGKSILGRQHNLTSILHVGCQDFHIFNIGRPTSGITRNYDANWLMDLMLQIGREELDLNTLHSLASNRNTKKLVILFAGLAKAVANSSKGFISELYYTLKSRIGGICIQALRTFQNCYHYIATDDAPEYTKKDYDYQVNRIADIFRERLSLAA